MTYQGCNITPQKPSLKQMSVLITLSAFPAKCLLNKAYFLSRSNALPPAAGAEAAALSCGRSQGSAGGSRSGSPAPGVLLEGTGNAPGNRQAQLCPLILVTGTGV